MDISGLSTPAFESPRMDSEPPVAAMPGPIITVEPAPFEPGAGEDPGWAHGRLAASYRAVAPGACPHRVRVRDLKGHMQFVFLVVVLLVYGSGLLSLGSLLFGGVMVGMSVGEADAVMLLVGSVMATLAAALVFGFVACVRVWRGLHQPGLAVCVLSTVAPPLILLFVAMLAFGGGLPWLMLLVVPPVAPMIALWYFRAVLYPRETCAGHPRLPTTIIAKLRR